jgi:hypothetical protein
MTARACCPDSPPAAGPHNFLTVKSGIALWAPSVMRPPFPAPRGKGERLRACLKIRHRESCEGLAATLAFEIRYFC